MLRGLPPPLPSMRSTHAGSFSAAGVNVGAGRRLAPTRASGGHAANGAGDEPCVAASAGTRRDHDTAARSSRATYAEVRLDAYAK